MVAYLILKAGNGFLESVPLRSLPWVSAATLTGGKGNSLLTAIFHHLSRDAATTLFPYNGSTS